MCKRNNLLLKKGLVIVTTSEEMKSIQKQKE